MVAELVQELAAAENRLADDLRARRLLGDIQHFRIMAMIRGSHDAMLNRVAPDRVPLARQQSPTTWMNWP